MSPSRSLNTHKYTKVLQMPQVWSWATMDNDSVQRMLFLFFVLLWQVLWGLSVCLKDFFPNLWLIFWLSKCWSLDLFCLFIYLLLFIQWAWTMWDWIQLYKRHLHIIRPHVKSHPLLFWIKRHYVTWRWTKSAFPSSLARGHHAERLREEKVPADWSVFTTRFR